jgi:hypothetical protein
MKTIRELPPADYAYCAFAEANLGEFARFS